MPEVKQGAATVEGTQLPKGGAQDVNAAYQAAAEAAPQTQTTPQPQTAQPQNQPAAPSAPPGLAPRLSGPVTLPNEEENLLFGPTNRPQEPVTHGAVAGSRMPVPSEVYKAYSALAAAARIPGASKQLVGLVDLLTHMMSQ